MIGLAALVGLVLFVARLAVKPVFDALDVRFEQMDKRFDQADQRFEQVDKRFDRLENRVVGLSETVHSIDNRQTGDDVWCQEADKRLTRIEGAQLETARRMSARPSRARQRRRRSKGSCALRR